MSNEHHILCGGTSVQVSGKPLTLNLWGGGDAENIQLRIEDLHKTLCRDIPQQFFDLVEIAAYVYCADQALKRTTQDTDTFGGDWRRNIHFHVPVRCLDLWNSPEIKASLENLLGFLSDDNYAFTFYPANRARAFQGYLGFSTENHSGRDFERVVMFSGGLDSLAGAIEETLVNKTRVVLVTHESTSKNTKLLREIQEQLAAKSGSLKPLHIRVRANKRKDLGKEYTQRTRSFLFATFGVAVAKMMGLDTLRFYENGVVSLNLPVSAQVVGSRATRTTHPRTLAGFQNLFSLLGNAPFTVENPFLWATKADVVQKILKASCGEMIKASTSCAHTWERTKDFTHCGACSQCIDRRLAIIAADAEAFDPIEHYRRDIFIDPRPADDDKMMLAAYLDRATSADECKNIAGFIAAFPQTADCFPFVSGGPTKVAAQCFDLYKRHAEEIDKALNKVITKYSSHVVANSTGGGSLIRTLIDSRGSIPAVSSDPVAIEEDLAEIRNRGAEWLVNFKGRDISVKNSVGMRYIVILLQNPGKEFRHSDLRLEVFPPENPETVDSFLATGAARGLPATDQKTLQEVRFFLETGLDQQRKAAREAGDLTALEQLEEEEVSAKAYERANRNKQGSPRHSKGIHQSTRVSVVKAITSVRKQLEKSERNRPFLEEIKKIRPGESGHLVYLPSEDPCWTVVDEK